MKIRIVGAAGGEVTGSAYCVQTRQASVLVDCGLFQGGKKAEAVKAQVHTLGGFSAHAGQTDLCYWFGALAPARPHVILTHGENGPREALARKIQQRFELKSTLPGLGDTIEL